MSEWRTCPPPMDGTVIVAIGRVTWANDAGGGSSPFSGLVAWCNACEQWLHADDAERMLAVAGYDDEVVHIDFWLPNPGGRAV
jgi:hypothetical protein